MENEIKIKDFVEVIKRRLWMLILITILVTIAAGLYSFYTTVPLYQSSVRILLPVERPEVINTLGVILKDPTVTDKVVGNLGLNRPSEELGRQINLSSENGSQIVRVSVVDPNQELAVQVANTTASVFIREIGNILGIYNAKVISAAKVDPDLVPINYNPRYNMDIGFAVGLVLGIGIALFLNTLDDSVRSEQEIARLLGQPVLGSISKISGKNLRNRYGKKTRTILKEGTFDA